MVKPILFSTPMVKAILDGRKTQTRRVVKPQPRSENSYFGGEVTHSTDKKLMGCVGFCRSPLAVCDHDYARIRYHVGDVLWVRETWRSTDFEYHDGKWTASIQYKDGNKGPRVSWWHPIDFGEPDNCIYFKTGWRPSIHLPREAARLFLRVTDVKVKRLHDISLKDIEQEGFYCEPEYMNPFRMVHYAYEPGMRIHFAKFWDSLNAKRGFSWKTNPWVWVISFEKTEKPEVGE